MLALSTRLESGLYFVTNRETLNIFEQRSDKIKMIFSEINLLRVFYGEMRDWPKGEKLGDCAIIHDLNL